MLLPRIEVLLDKSPFRYVLIFKVVTRTNVHYILLLYHKIGERTE